MRKITLLVLCFNLAGCSIAESVGDSFSGVSNYFKGGEDNAELPNKLVDYEPEVHVKVLWKESVGVGADEQSLKLVPAINGNKIFAADREGVVQARDLKTGDLLWKVKTEMPFSGGVGVGNDVVVLGSSEAEVIALDSDTGKKRWKVRVPSEVLAVPVVAQGVVSVRTSDGSMLALDEKTGAKKWSYEVNMPPLSIRGASSPLVVNENLIAGYDTGKLIALRLNDGKTLWESNIAIPQGRSEIERLVDVDVDPIEVGGTIYTASYHGGISAVSSTDGEMIWRNENISSHTGLSHDWRYLYLTDSASDVWQIEQRSGSPLWKQKDLHQRALSAPASYSNYVVVGDYKGYVHWLSNSDGRQLGREQITSSAIEAKPLVVDDVVYVYAKDGTLAALTLSSK